jgi:regulatory protein
LIDDGMDENPDIAAAIRYAQRRRLGPWRSPERQRALAERDKIKDQETRDMGAMARAGFSRDVAMRALAKNTEETEES